MMWTIFAGAYRVIFWLGEARPRDTLAFTTLDAFERVERAEVSHVKDKLTLVNERMQQFPYCSCCNEQILLPEQPRDEPLNSCAALLRRSWFDRLWVVQEILASNSQAAQLCVGSHRTDWHHFRRVFRWCRGKFRKHSKAESPTSPLWAEERLLLTRLRYLKFDLNPMQDGRFRLPHSYKILRALVRLSHRKCADGRNRILAVRRILGLDTLEGLSPDYELSREELYRRAVLAILFPDPPSELLPEKTTGLAFAFMLALVGTEDVTQISARRASWVPDLHNLTSRSRHKIGRHDDWMWERACISRLQLTQLSDTTLEIRAKEYTVVEHVCSVSQCPLPKPEDG
jgi:hypothetical protein